MLKVSSKLWLSPGTVVGHTSNNPKTEGLNPATGTRREGNGSVVMLTVTNNLI
jgi:hypothetical protein